MTCNWRYYFWEVCPLFKRAIPFVSLSPHTSSFNLKSQHRRLFPFHHSHSSFSTSTHSSNTMNKDALIKYGVQQVLSPYRPKAPGSELQKQTVIEMEASQQKKRYFWQRKPDPLDYLTPHERAVLKKVKKQARWLDKGIGCCCCQVGVDPIIGELSRTFMKHDTATTNIISPSKV